MGLAGRPMAETLLALPIRGAIPFPGAQRTVIATRPQAIAAAERAAERDQPVALVAVVEPDVEDPQKAALTPVGIAARIERLVRLPDGSLRLLVDTHQRVKIAGGLGVRDGAYAIGVDRMTATIRDARKVAALAREIHAVHDEWMSHQDMSTGDRDAVLVDEARPERLADQVMSMLEPTWPHALAILAEPVLDVRLELVVDQLVTALAAARIRADVHQRVQGAMDESQREYQLREQLKAIRKELGDAGPEADADRFRERIEAGCLPPEAKAEALREADRLTRMHADSAEYTVARTWLETVCDLPWNVLTPDTTDIRAASAILDEDHHGLGKVKDRILEYLAVRKLAPDHRGAILCFVGPPGVGKTSLGMSIARALGRKAARLALGGVRDEAEIRGHRRTYVGALPGRVLRAIVRAGTRNPVLVLDELDKLGNDFRGDPASALLEVLDPEQNHAFVDHYLDLDFDLSQVLFIATANQLDTIPSALHDRLEVIELPGYTEEEKLEIARRFLLPRLGKDHGVGPDKLQFPGDVLRDIVRDHTREAGVRELQRQLARIHRKAARAIVEDSKGKTRVTSNALVQWLGPRKFLPETLETVQRAGVVVGLAWTPAGGDILVIEATRMPGKGALKVTGSLGDVMKESAEAAMSWLRTNAAALSIDATAFDADFHVHVPAGAIPKDGPSAGVTMASALASIATGRKGRPGFAMTGEITLRGRVLPVGGIQEKALAARRAGVTDLILPRKNADDLAEVPKGALQGVRVHLVDDVFEVLDLALEGSPAAQRG